MIRIVQLIDGLPVGGAEMAYYRLNATIDRTRFDITLVAMQDGGALAPRIRALGLPLFSLGWRKEGSVVGALARLIGLLRRVRPQVLQTWLYTTDVIGLFAGSLVRVPDIVWNIRCADTGSLFATGKYRLLLGLHRRLSRYPTAIVANSFAGRRHHEALGHRPKRWQVIPNGFDLDLFRPDPAARAAVRAELGVAPDSVLIGLIARHDPLKDHANFLKAAARVQSGFPGVRFVLVGRGVTWENDALSALIRQLDLSERVYLLGERNDVARLTAAFDIASCSSSGEGFPNVIGEAMACAVPCVSTDVGDAASIVGDTGRIVAPGDAAALAAGWREMIDLEAGGRARLGEAARERIADRFSLGAVARQYEQLYETIADERLAERSNLQRQAGGHR